MDKNDDAPSRFRFRALTSIVSAVLFIAMLVSGLVLYLAPAHGAGRRHWALWGLGTLDWAAFHATLSILFALACVIHVAFNFKTLLCYIRRGRAKLGHGWLLGLRREFAVGAALGALLVLGALYDLPPLSALRGLQHELAAPGEPGARANDGRHHPWADGRGRARGWRGGRWRDGGWRD
jgi:hypothetical protein